MSIIDLADVRRIETATGSHIEPALDQSWTQLDKLRWNARVVEVDCGLPMGTFDIRQHGDKYAVCHPAMGGMHEPYGDAWIRLVVLGEGVRLACRVHPVVTTRLPRTDEQGHGGTSGHRHDGEAYKATGGDE